MSVPSERKVLVQCHALGLQFGPRRVIENFSLKVHSGDKIAFLGPSGCGKSTLLNLISGLILPSQGQVERHLSVEKISFVFQDSSLFPWKTVRENLQLINGLIRTMKLDSAQIDARIAMLLQQVGLADRVDSFPDELSGGMKMRVALARALINEPQLLLLDEPFAALDDLTRERLQEDLLKLQMGQETAFILVTHNINEALYLCDRIFVFNQNGRVLREFSFVENTDSVNRRETLASVKFQDLRRDIRQLWGDASRGESAHA